LHFTKFVDPVRSCSSALPPVHQHAATTERPTPVYRTAAEVPTEEGDLRKGEAVKRNGKNLTCGSHGGEVPQPRGKNWTVRHNVSHVHASQKKSNGSECACPGRRRRNTFTPQGLREPCAVSPSHPSDIFAGRTEFSQPIRQ